MKDTGEDKIRLLFLGTCMGALLIQRKILPLHGSAIEIDGKAYAIRRRFRSRKVNPCFRFLK